MGALDDLDPGQREALNFAGIIREEVLSIVETLLKGRYSASSVARVMIEVRNELTRLDGETIDQLVQEAKLESNE